MTEQVERSARRRQLLDENGCFGAYVTCSDDGCRDAFFKLSRREGIIPALESAHAVSHALVKAREMGTGTILVNLSGRGDKDMDHVIEHWGIGDDA